MKLLGFEHRFVLALGVLSYTSSCGSEAASPANSSGPMTDSSEQLAESTNAGEQDGDMSQLLDGLVELEGTIRVVGPALFSEVLLDSSSGTLVIARGAVADELRRLQSALVRVEGCAAKGQLQPCGYEIMDVGGGTKPSAVGTITLTESDRVSARKRDCTTVLLSAREGIEEALRELTGAKVWISGDPVGDGEVQVRRYGILRDAPDPRELSSAGDDSTCHEDNVAQCVCGL